MTIDFGPYFSTPGIGVFRGCSCLRQSQAVAKKQASFCWPCFPYYLFLLAFLFPNKQPKLPSPTFLVLLPSPAFLVLLALSSHSSQTNNQTNNQRSKHTNKRQTTQRSAFETVVKDTEIDGTWTILTAPFGPKRGWCALAHHPV